MRKTTNNTCLTICYLPMRVTVLGNQIFVEKTKEKYWLALYIVFGKAKIAKSFITKPTRKQISRLRKNKRLCTTQLFYV